MMRLLNLKPFLPHLTLGALIFCLNGCATYDYFFPTRDGAPTTQIDVSKIPNPTPHHEPKSRYGNMSTYTVRGKQYHVLPSAHGFHQRGTASWYGTKFNGQLTSSREPYDMWAMTAASRTLPLPTYVRVTNLENHRQIIVRVNDRGPFHSDRILDLSYAAAKKLGMMAKGTATVEVAAIEPETHPITASDPHRHYLQVGIFKSYPNAQTLRHQLLQYTNKSIVIYPKTTQTPYYRVLVGPYVTKSQLATVKHYLNEHGFNAIPA